MSLWRCRSWTHFLQQYDQNRIALYMNCKIPTHLCLPQDKNRSTIQIAVTGTQSRTVKLSICCTVCKQLFSMHDLRKPCETRDRRFKTSAEKKEAEPKFTHHTHSKLTRCRSRGNLSWSAATLAACSNEEAAVVLAVTTQSKHLDFNLKKTRQQKALKIKSDKALQNRRGQQNLWMWKWQQC